VKKLKLDVDALRVDSFDAVPSAAARDGVRAHEVTEPTMYGSFCLCSEEWDGGTCGNSQCTGPCLCNIQPSD